MSFKQPGAGGLPKYNGGGKSAFFASGGGESGCIISPVNGFSTGSLDAAWPSVSNGRHSRSSSTLSYTASYCRTLSLKSRRASSGSTPL